MSFLGRLLGYVSMLVNAALALFLLGLGFIGSMSGSEMTVDLIPVAPESMAMTLMASGLAGLAAAVLALRAGRVARTPLLLWSVLVTSMLICAFTRSSYRFEGEEHFRTGVWVFLASLILLWGSWKRWKITPAAKRAAAVGR